MSFFQVDDQLAANRKTRQLVEMVLSDNVDGYAAICLWTLAGADCKAEGSDGVVTSANLIRLMLDLSRAKRYADLLVDVGLWHAPGHTCERCPVVAPNTWLYHDWYQFAYDPAEKERTAVAKRKELRDRQIIAEVWARDCIDPANPTVAACRYCGTTVRKKDTVSHLKPHLDHIDPTRAVGSRNIVVTCSPCNQHKGNHFPEERDMKLLPAPRSKAVGDAAGPLSPRHAAGPHTGNRVAQHSGRDADSAHSAPTADRAETEQPTSGRPTSGPPPGQPVVDGDQTVPARVRAGTGAWPGSGQGLGRGVGKGGPTPPEPSPGSGRSRRRKRRRAHPPQQQVNPPPSHDAGPPPDDVRTAGQFGSPYRGWTGPPDVTGDESDCPTHHLPEPCRKCMNGATSET